MKRQSILFILFLLLTLFICCGCGSAAKSTAEDTDAARSSDAEIPLTSEPEDAASDEEAVEDVIGIFEGLEDNHTAVFSFDGAETAFYFEDPAVQNILFEAITGSPYTLSYKFDSSLGLNVIYKISE